MDYDTLAITSLAPLSDEATIDWSSDAPRGGRAVLGRIMKEKATVPLFFAQTLVQSLRDVGYPTGDIVANDHDALAARSVLRLLQARVSTLDWRIAMRLGQGFDYADIASVEGISSGALRVRISRMRVHNAELHLAA